MNFLQIPEHVLIHASKLSGLQLAILADAWTWDRNGKDARRSNDQYAEMLGATARGVTKAVKTLQELGLVELHYGANNIRHIKPRTTVHLNDRSPRTTVHPEQSFTPALNDRSTPPERPFTPSPERPFTLIEKEIENKEEKRIEKGERKPKIEIVMPWPSDEFAQMWQEWKDYKKAEHRFTYKSPRTEQATLHKLQQDAKDNEQLAIFAITKSITSGWKGLFINSKLEGEFNSTHASTAGGDWTEAEFRHWAKTGEMPVKHF